MRCSSSWLEAGAVGLDPGRGGPLTLPDWLPPAGAPHRRGVLWGLDGTHGPHGPHHLCRSVLEGIVLTMRTHVEAIESALEQSPGRLVMSGGGSRSELMCRIVADVFGRAVERAGVADAAALGAAICAAVGHGLHPTSAPRGSVGAGGPVSRPTT
jgi:sugar (pentulose or hexulose) kinase